MSIRSTFERLLALPLLLVAGVMAPQVQGGEVQIFQADSPASFLEGRLEGLRVDPVGSLELATSGRRIATLEEPYLFAVDTLADGWVLGTGNSGRVLHLGLDGELRTLHEAEEPAVFAVLGRPDGTIYAATSPGGKVLEIRGDAVKVLHELSESYVWDLAWKDGRLLVATGLPGRLYSIDPRGGESELLMEAGDSHLRTVEVLEDGALLAGTAGRGLILRRDQTGKVETLYDGPEPEILAFARPGDGRTFVAALASEASLVDLATGPEEPAEEQAEESSAVDSIQGTQGSRGAGTGGPRSVILELAKDGSVDRLLGFASETVHALTWHGEALWIGTGQEGKLYRYGGTSDPAAPKGQSGLVLEKDLEESQIIALASGKSGLTVATTDLGAIHLLGDEPEPEGRYVSPVLDAGRASRFGSLIWRGRSAEDSLKFSVRSGMSQLPDGTWTAWRELGDDSELSLKELGRGRYLQWKAVLRAGKKGAGPRVDAVEISYLQDNLKPTIESLVALDPGKILVPTNFNPANQTYEPWSPNRQGIFTSLTPAPEAPGATKELWKRGFRTLQWEATDGNSDPLRYSLEVRPEGGGTWLAVAEELAASYFSFESTVLPDGVYRFRLKASDASGARPGEALEAVRISEPVVLDHSAPRLVSKTRDGERYRLVVEDLSSPLRRAEISIDAGPWEPAHPVDGLVDTQREELEIPAPREGALVILRLMDAAHNVVTLDLESEIH